MRKLASVLLLALAVLVAAGTTVAQTSTGQISGTVQDQTGAMVPGAKVVVKNEATSATYETQTTSAGAFAVASLLPGEYTVTVTASGFQTFQSVKNVVSVGGTVVVNATMQIGAQTSVVTVESTYERLDTANAMLSGVVSRKEIVELPLNGRNPLNLIVFEPGLIQRSSGAAGSGTHVFGSRDRAHNVTIDGIDANESSVPNPQSNIHRLTPDNVQEYRVVTHNATAEFGRNSGANVAISTRAGTNEFHGDLFYFHRNTALNSHEFFAKADAQLSGTVPEKPVILLHQFGGDIGGPIVKNRTFFFFSYQGNRIKQSQPISQSFGNPLVYTASAKQGIFRYVRGSVTIPGTTTVVNQNDRRLVDPATGNLQAGIPVCAGVLGGTATNNCVDGFDMFAADPAGIGADSNMLQMLNSFPLPNTFSIVGDGLNTASFNWNPPSQFKGPFYRGRIDHKFNDNHSIFGSFNWTKYNTEEGDFLNARPQLFPGFNPLGEVNRTSQLLSLSYRAVLSPQLVNEFTMGYSRFNFFFSLNESNQVSGTLAAIGQECFGTDSLGNVDSPYCNTPHTQRAVSTIQFIDNLSYIRGNHTIRSGFNIRFYRHNDSRGVPGGFNMSPTITFAQATRNPTSALSAPASQCTPAPGPPPTGNNNCLFVDPTGISTTDRTTYRQAVVEFMGIPARVQQVFQANLSGDVYTTDLFTMGTRIKHVDGYIQDEWKWKRNLTITYGLRWEWKQPGKDCCDRVFVPDRDILGSQGPVTFIKADSWWGRDNASALAPRVSFAWQPFSDGKTVVRAGWGMAFDTVSSFQVTSVSGKVPGSTLQCFTNVPVSGTSTPPAGCATLSGVVPPGARLTQVLSSLTTGGAFQLPMPTSTPSQNFLLPDSRSGATASVGAFDPNLKVPTVHEWNLTIQRELPWGMTAQVGYIGKRGIRLYRAYDINQLYTNQSGFLPSFLIAQNNVFLGCDPDGTVAGSSTTACAATGAAVPTLLMQLSGCSDAAGVPTAACTFLNGRSADFTNNALGNLALQIDTNISQTANGRNLFATNYFRPNAQFNEIFYFDSGGSSSYHGLIAQVNRRFSRGLTFSFSYTWSKSIDDMSVDPVAATSGGALGHNSRTPTDVRNFAIDRTVSDFDNRHVVSSNALWEIPFGKGRKWGNSLHPVLDHIVGGWSITNIVTAQSGEPFTLNSGAATFTSTAVQKQSTLDVRGPFVQPGLFDLSGVAGPNVYNVGPRITTPTDPNFNCRNVLQPDGTATSTYFCIPAPGTHGNSGRNSVYGPGFWNTDFGILKNFNITERWKVQFRAELFNAFNHTNFRNPRNASTGSPTLTSSLFGQTCCVADSVPSSQTIIAVGEPNRVIQFGLKIAF
jgi:hypothetical protein